VTHRPALGRSGTPALGADPSLARRGAPSCLSPQGGERPRRDLAENGKRDRRPWGLGRRASRAPLRTYYRRSTATGLRPTACQQRRKTAGDYSPGFALDALRIPVWKRCQAVSGELRTGPRSCARMGVSRLRRTVRAPARANPAAEVRALSEDFSAHPPFESSHSVPSVVKSPRRAARKPRRLRFHSQRFSTVSTASWGVSSGPSQDGWIAFFA